MAKRQRGKNFDPDELSLLTELVDKNIHILNSKLTNTVTNVKKQEIWKDIAKQISALGKHPRSVKDVKVKWMNITSTAKKEFSAQAIYQRGTGGGPPPKPLSSSMEKVVDMFKDNPGFVGLASGVEAPPPVIDDTTEDDEYPAPLSAVELGPSAPVLKSK